MSQKQKAKKLRAARVARRRQRYPRMSTTRGIDKGLNCQKTIQKVQFVKDSRFYKKKPLEYVQACLITAQHAKRGNDINQLLKRVVEFSEL